MGSLRSSQFDSTIISTPLWNDPCVTWGNRTRLAASSSIVLGCICIATLWPASMFSLACLLAMLSLAKRHSLVAGFIFIAAVHCILGYFGAFQAGKLIFTYFDHEATWYAQASFAIALGLFGMSTAYKVSDHSAPTWIESLPIDEDRLRFITKGAVLIGAALMVWVYAKLSVLQLMLSNLAEIGHLRYLGGEAGSDVYLMARALDILTYTLPLLWVLRRGRGDKLIYLVGMLAFLLPLRRASLIFVLLIPFLVNLKAVNYRKIGLILLGFIILYGVSQIVFLNTDEYSTITILGSALPEVRDLAWASRLLDGRFLNGDTFFQQFNPVPAFLSESKRTSTMEYITATLLGYDPDARKFAGLRTTMAGEAYLNFWFIGPPVIGYFLGKGAAWAERSLYSANTISKRYLAAIMLCWICFWLYMGGTQAVASIKAGAVVTFLLFLLSRSRMPDPISAST
jgi:hypothetical protein